MDILMMVGVAVLWGYWLYWLMCQVRYEWASRRARMTSSLADDLASTLVAQPELEGPKEIPVNISA